MSLKVLFLAAFALFASAEVMLASGDSSSSAVVQDPSCRDVNGAYLKTHGSAAFHVLMYRREDEKPFMETVVDKPYGYERQIRGGKWTSFNPEVYPIDDMGRGPKYTECRFVRKVMLNSISAKHYKALWHRFPNEARSDIWISNADGRILKIIRKYQRWEFSSDIIVETYDYDAANFKLPEPEEVQE
jgi:hypothetical protein